jgi:thiol-disulfide isomerase/thioredoxin
MDMKIIALVIGLALITGCGQQNEIRDVNSIEVTSQGNKEKQEDKDIEKSIGLNPGQVPPSLALETMAGEVFSEASLKGKKVAINFWASWCGPCHMEMPDLVRFANENPDDFIVVAVNIAETLNEVEPFVEEYGITFPVLLDKTGELSQEYQVLGLPTTIFLHSDGTIASKHVGVITWHQLIHAYQNLD